MYDLVSFVGRGKIRKKILKNLSEPRTPTQLSSKIGTHRSTISRAMLSLEDKGLLKCLTPNEKLGRYYSITETGKKVLKLLGEE